MKYIDKFLKVLNTDRNTFVTYILTLLTIYFAVDRIVEMLLMVFTGVSHSYWGPLMYTFALACPVFAYVFVGPSKFATSKNHKITLFYLYVIALYIIAISMFTQWINMGAWLLLLSVPNYVEIITEFSDLVTPAFISISLYLPLVTIYPLFRFLFMDVNDSLQKKRSIWDYPGINLADKKAGRGPYTCEVYLCHNSETGKCITIPEISRYQSLLVCGASGTGKSSLVYEPLMAKDIEKKFFFHEASKELGFTALKTKIAHLNKPYDNDYLNKHFNLSMLTPTEGKETVFKAFVKNMLLNSSSELIYRDLGLTLMSPDYEIIDHMISVCKNFGFDYNIIDPENPYSIGLNPFVYDDPAKTALTILACLKAMYTVTHTSIEETFREDLCLHAIQNTTILLKEMYPRMNDGALPNLEDLLRMFTNFELIEKMCEIMAHDEKLAEKYSIQLAYFKNNFYKDGRSRETTEKYIYSAVAQLDALLRVSGVKNILCNRHNNIDFDKTLANGEITFICTRRGDLGSSGNSAFGLFFLISMQNAVLRRPGSENSRIPHFLYIDEFPDFVCKATEPIFTMYRKYKVATTISAQNIDQLSGISEKENYRKTILSNCANKIFTGGATIEDLEWWSKEFGTHREWVMSDTIDFAKMEYESKHSGVSWKFVENFKVGKLQTLPNNSCAFKIRDINGRHDVGPGKLSYMASKYKEPQKIKTYDFGKYSDGVTTTTEDINEKKKFDLKNVDFIDERDEFNPVQTDTTDSKYLFDNEDAIVVNLKKKRNK